MKKKLLSMLLISAMCLSTAGDTVLAASADFELDVQAENEDFLTGSVELTDGTDEDSEVSEPGAPDDGNSGEDAGLGDGEDSGLGDGEDPGQDTELTDISGYESWQDFEKTDFDEVLEDRGAARINRVYRQLAVCPAMYWKENEDADALYLKNQRKWVSKYLQKNLGGNLDIYKNAAFFTLEDRDGYGAVHPRDAMLPEAVLLLCAKLQQELTAGKIRKEENERIVMEKSRFAKLLLDCRQMGWSKEFREMEEEKLLDAILTYMKDWMMLEEKEEQIVILPGAGRLAGRYPEDFNRLTGGTEHE